MQKRGFMTEVRRLLKEGGRAIIVTRLKTFFRRSGVGKEELEKLLNTDGFRLVRRSLKRGQAVAVLVKAT
jgi:hypothetical protein